MARASRWLGGASYLQKWLVLGVLIGAMAGVGAIVFYEALLGATHLFLGVLAGYHVPTPVGEGGHAASASFSRPWALPLVVGLGALLGAILVFRFAPDAEGHGTDAAISAVHHNPRGIRFRTVIVKIVASALTIGSGGSGGREGPTGQISAGFASLLARELDLSPADARIGGGDRDRLGHRGHLRRAARRSGAGHRDPLPGRLRRRGAPPLLRRLDRRLRHLRRRHRVHAAVRLQRQLPLHRPLAAPVVRPDRRAGRPHRPPLRQGLLRDRRGVRPLAGCPVGSSRPSAACWSVRIAFAIPEVLGTGYGWIQQSLGHQLLHPAAVDRPRPALRPHRGHRAVDRLRAAPAASSVRAWSSAPSSARRSGGCSTRSSRRWATARRRT